jgi:hypothetical protein
MDQSSTLRHVGQPPTARGQHLSSPQGIGSKVAVEVPPSRVAITFQSGLNGERSEDHLPTPQGGDV